MIFRKRKVFKPNRSKYDLAAKFLLSLFVAVLASLSIFSNSDYFLRKAGVRNTYQASVYNVVKARDFEQSKEQIKPPPVVLIEEDPDKIYAKSALSVEFNEESEKILFSQNENEVLPIASLTKLMTALIVLENYDLNQEITISSKVMEIEGVQGVLKEGEILTTENLLYIMLMESSNRAAYALSELMGNDNFIELMNKKAKELGLKNTNFKDATGLDENSYSTAKDLYNLSKYLFINQPLFSNITSFDEYYLYLNNGSLHHKLENTNKLLGEIPNIIGGKTGFTLRAKGCFIAIQKKYISGSYVIHIVLGADDREKQIRKLISLTEN